MLAIQQLKNYPLTSRRSLEILIRQMSNCIFCKIVTEDLPSETVYQDDDIIIFKDIRPVSNFHYLAIPKRHIPNVNALTIEDKNLVEKLIDEGKQVLVSKGGDPNNVKLGFHLPPFNTVSHLHLHIISPTNSMSWFHRIAFKDNSWWFATANQILEKMLNNSKL